MKARRPRIGHSLIKCAGVQVTSSKDFHEKREGQIPNATFPWLGKTTISVNQIKTVQLVLFPFAAAFIKKKKKQKRNPLPFNISIPIPICFGEGRRFFYFIVYLCCEGWGE